MKSKEQIETKLKIEEDITKIHSNPHSIAIQMAFCEALKWVLKDN
jgi:hypothetical protein